MADWDARQYLAFEDERTRAARDLLARIPLDAPVRVTDIGCGPGNSTELLAQRWPNAEVTGFDTSPDMLATARKRLPNVTFSQSDVSSWQASQPQDVIYGNAVLQWVPDHPALLPRLMGKLAQGGCLAIQMPDNLDEPSHELMRKTAADGPWASALKQAAGARTRLGSYDDYYGWLRPHASAVDIWRTTYVHPLDGAAAIVEWVKATGLRPFIDPLNEAMRRDFLAAYEAEIAKAYPLQSDGNALLRFPRLFLVAQR